MKETYLSCILASFHGPTLFDLVMIVGGGLGIAFALGCASNFVYCLLTGNKWSWIPVPAFGILWVVVVLIVANNWPAAEPGPKQEIPDEYRYPAGFGPNAKSER